MILTVFSRSIFELLITSQHVLHGRRLTVRESLNGDRQAEFEKAHNLKRVVLNYVPRWVTDEELRTVLESHFGEIDRIYSFPDRTNRNFKVGYVNFFKEESAKLAIANENIRIGHGVTVRVIPFKQRDTFEEPASLVHRPISIAINSTKRNLHLSNRAHQYDGLRRLINPSQNVYVPFGNTPLLSFLDSAPITKLTKLLKRTSQVYENHEPENIQITRMMVRSTGFGRERINKSRNLETIY